MKLLVSFLLVCCACYHVTAIKVCYDKLCVDFHMASLNTEKFESWWKQPEPEPRNNPDENYDIVLDGNSLSALLEKKSWDVSVFDWNITHQAMTNGVPGAMTIVIGLYNKGKTWFLSRLAGVTLPSMGEALETKGISIKTTQLTEGTSIILLDTAGRQAPVNMISSDPHTDRIALVLIDIAHYFIIVVGDVTYTDQVLLADVISSRTDDQFRKIAGFGGHGQGPMIVHNWMKTHPSGVEAKKRRVIYPTYPGGRNVTFQQGDGIYYSSMGLLDQQGQNRQVAVNHFFMVNDDTAEGKKWNDAAFAEIRNWLANRIDPFYSQSPKFPLVSLAEALNRYLPDYLSCHGSGDVLDLHFKEGKEIELVVHDTWQDCAKLRPQPIPNVYPVPQGGFNPVSSSQKLSDGSFLLEVEVPGVPHSSHLVQQEVDNTDDYPPGVSSWAFRW
mmetsp:Transcript_39054/g.61820  ORF Transcript_39054/g.61820 Transcript_39054/m.61820 type:complete len:442 (-) Transcript_39054:378-1703(-)